MGRTHNAARLTLAFAALAGVACVAPNTYVYQPTEQPTATSEGAATARYAIPPAAPRGTVRVASFGVTELRVDDGADVPVLHVRLVVANDSGAPWTVDTRHVLLDLPNHGTSRPAFANADRAGLPLADVPPAQQRALDLYYPLPAGMNEPDDIVAFSVLWSVQTDTGVITVRTPFERYRLETQPGEWGVPTSAEASWRAAFDFGPTSSAYYDPLFPSYTFGRPSVIVKAPLAPRDVRVQRRVRRHR